MLKKFISVVLSITMLLSMASVVNVFASTTLFSEIDASKLSLGTAVTSHGGYGTHALVVQEDGENAVVIAPNQTSYSLNGNTYGLLNFMGDFNNTTDFSSLNSKGIVIESTLKIEKNVGGLFLTPNLSNVSPRYLSLIGGTVYYTPSLANDRESTGLTYPIDTWFTIKLSWNTTTGYFEISVKDLSTGVETKTNITSANWISNINTTTFGWYYDGEENYIYIKNLKVFAEDDATAIAPPPPSKIVIRDDFDSNESNIAAPWYTTNIPVEETDRGKSAAIAGNETLMHYYNENGIIPADAKGLALEFSTKITYTNTRPHFVISLITTDGAWFYANNRIMNFSALGTLDRDSTDTNIIIDTWEADKWYDVRMEISFNSQGSATYRYIVYDGNKEIVKVFENVSTTLFDTLSKITNISFAHAGGDGKAYLDNVNLYWLDSESASGIKANTVNPVDINLENYAEGTEQITADMACETPFATYSGSASFAVETVKNSGRGKSLKISTTDSSYEFYKAFTTIQNGTVSFDIMFPEIKGTTIIKTQQTTANTNYEPAFMFLRFNANGNVTNPSQEKNYGQYEAGKWYKLIVTANSENNEGYQNFKLIGDTGVIAEDTISLGASNNVAYDSIRYLGVLMADAPNSIYIDNFKAYAPALAPAGIHPVGQSALKEGAVLTGSKIVLPFSKPVDLAKSEFKVNGEEVTATGYEIITLPTELEEGEEYTVEYTVYDLDGFKTEGYISGISCEGAFTVTEFSEASLQNPAATATVKVSKAVGSKEIKLYVAAYKAGEMINLNVDSKTLNSQTATFSAQVNATDADEVKTFLWDGATLTPIK